MSHLNTIMTRFSIPPYLNRNVYLNEYSTWRLTLVRYVSACVEPNQNLIFQLVDKILLLYLIRSMSFHVDSRALFAISLLQAESGVSRVFEIVKNKPSSPAAPSFFLYASFGDLQIVYGLYLSGSSVQND